MHSKIIIVMKLLNNFIFTTVDNLVPELHGSGVLENPGAGAYSKKGSAPHQCGGI